MELIEQLLREIRDEIAYVGAQMRRANDLTEGVETVGDTYGHVNPPITKKKGD